MARPRKVVQPEQAAQTEQQSPAQALAMRIWAGQSVSLSRKVRAGRIESALAEHGFTADEIKAVELPA